MKEKEIVLNVYELTIFVLLCSREKEKKEREKSRKEKSRPANIGIGIIIKE